MFVDTDGDTEPECFGEYWEAVGPDDETWDCRGCDYQDICRTAVVQQKMRKLIPTLDSPTVQEVSEHLEINPEATEILMQDYRALYETTRTKAKRPKRSPKKKQPESAAQAPESPPETGGPPENPMRASSAQPAADGAPSISARIYARIVGVWDVEHRLWLRPWEAQRARMVERSQSKWIRRLYPGMVLRRRFQGKMWTVRVCRYGYQLQGIKYPTLRAATQALQALVAARRLIPAQSLSTPQEVAKWWRLPVLLTPVRDYQKRASQASTAEVSWLLKRYYDVG